MVVDVSSTMMKTYLLFFFIQLLHQNISVETAPSALCFLTRKPAVETLQFAEELGKDGKQYGLDVYVMIDDDNYNISSLESSSHFIPLKMSKEKCVSYGYQEALLLRGNWLILTSWDKALLFFCVLNQHYSFVWFVEDDVFIPSVQAFRSIHQLYSTNSDLVVTGNEINLLGNSSTWLWYTAVGLFIPPWSMSMVNMVGLSRRLLSAVANDVQWRGRLAFHEFYFHTLAISLNMTIVNPLELINDYWVRTYAWEQIRRQPNNFWHTVKDPNTRHIWRQRLVYRPEVREWYSSCPIIQDMLFISHVNISNVTLSPEKFQFLLSPYNDVSYGGILS